MKKSILLYLFFVFILPASTAYPLDLYITGNRLSVHADNEPLRDILQALADQGITVRADPGINPSVTASFDNREIEQGLKTLFRNLNHILVWKNIDTPAGRFIRLEEIHLFIPGKKDLAKTFLPNISRLAKNPADGSVYIKNEILIRLSGEIDLKAFKYFLMQKDLTVSGYNKITRIIRIILPEKADYFAILEMIKKYPGIDRAEPNYAYPIGHPVLTPGSVSDTSGYRAALPSGNPAPVAVIDSGLSGDYLSAPYVYASFNSLDPDKPVSDSLGHGTQMAMIAGGAVKPVGADNETDTSVPVIAIKGFADDGYISNFDLMNGIEFSLEKGARVMSLSWGSETKSEFIEQAFDYAASKGLIVLAAAGNEPTGDEMYPAGYNSVIGVGALDPEGKKWDKSNYGDFVTIYAPGFASLPVGYNGKPGTYAGTSISTAYVANRIAGYLSKNPDASIKEILTSLADKNDN